MTSFLRLHCSSLWGVIRLCQNRQKMSAFVLIWACVCVLYVQRLSGWKTVLCPSVMHARTLSYTRTRANTCLACFLSAVVSHTEGPHQGCVIRCMSALVNIIQVHFNYLCSWQGPCTDLCSICIKVHLEAQVKATHHTQTIRSTPNTSLIVNCNNPCGFDFNPSDI